MLFYSLFALQSSSVSPSASFRTAEKHRNSTDYSSDSKKQKTEEKEIAARYVSRLSTLCIVEFQCSSVISPDSCCITNFKIEDQILTGSCCLLLMSLLY